ncbi:MAG: hypothetical protein IT379_33750 [Deltaproteobacteria bacterium]|nr:hypothetical protein [Deltaproteobacteria bacterium]
MLARLRTPLLALLAFEALSGAFLLVCRGAGAVELSVVVGHVAAGVPFLALLALWMVAHLRKRWRSPLRSQLIGWSTLGVLAACIATGVVLLWVGTGAQGRWAYWAHLATGIVCSAGAAVHVVPWLRRARGWPRVALGAAAAMGLSLAGWALFRPPETARGEIAELGPGRTRVDGGRTVDPNAVANSRWCAHSGCHEDVHRQWSDSTHRFSSTNPWFLASERRFREQRGVAESRYCAGCHDPVSLLSGGIAEGRPQRDALGDEGITCLACHGMVGLSSRQGTASYVWRAPERYPGEMDPDGVGGVLAAALIRLRPEAHARAMMPAFVRTIDLCTACHKQDIDEGVNRHRWLPLQDQFDDWQQSAYSTESIQPFYRRDEPATCNDCHMRPEASPSDASATAGTTASHRYAGAEMGIPEIYGLDEQLREVERWLTTRPDGGPQIDVSVVSMRREDGRVEAPLDAGARVAPGERVELDVLVTNRGVAHGFPTGPIDVYEAWLAAEVRDGEGRLLAESGGLDARGRLDPGAHRFVKVIGGEDGEPLWRHELWDYRYALYGRTLPAGASEVVRFSWTVPEGATGAFTVSTRMRYRRFNRDYDVWVRGEQSRPLRIWDLDVDEVSLAATGDPRRVPAPRGLAPLWRRWNDYGIGLLRRREEAIALSAFETVERLRPAESDPIVNQARALRLLGRVDEALSRLGRVPAGQSRDLRVRNERAFALAAAGGDAEAMVILEGLVREKPRDRALWTLLGILRLRNDDARGALRAYDRVLAIDPWDLAASDGRYRALRELGSPLAEAASRGAHRYRSDEHNDARVRPLRTRMPEADRETNPRHVHPLEPPRSISATRAD